MPERRNNNSGDRRSHHRPTQAPSNARSNQPSRQTFNQHSNTLTAGQAAIHEAGRGQNSSRHQILARFQEILNNHLIAPDPTLLFEDAGSEFEIDEEQFTPSPAPSIYDLWKRVITVDDQDEDDEAICYVCQEDVEIGAAVTYLSASCQHWFCTECLKPWLEDQGQDTCPVCREKIVGTKK